MDSAYVGLIGGLGGASIVGYLSFATQAYMHNRAREVAKREDYRLKLYDVFSTITEAYSAMTEHISMEEIGLNTLNASIDHELERRIEAASDRHMSLCNKASASTLTLKFLKFEKSTKLAQDLIYDMYDIEKLIGKRVEKDKLASRLKIFIDQVRIDYDSLF